MLSAFNTNRSLDGRGYVIDGLFIDRTTSGDDDRIGLFGATSGATMQHVGIINVNIHGDDYVGG